MFQLNKYFLITMAALLPGLTQAASCPFGPDARPKLLETLSRMQSCAKAVHTARLCFQGNGSDSSIENAAGSACDRFFHKALSEADHKLLSTLKARCDSKFASEAGTLAISAQASCRLDVYKVFQSLAAPFEN